MHAYHVLWRSAFNLGKKIVDKGTHLKADGLDFGGVAGDLAFEHMAAETGVGVVERCRVTPRRVLWGECDVDVVARGNVKDVASKLRNHGQAAIHAHPSLEKRENQQDRKS